MLNLSILTYTDETVSSLNQDIYFTGHNESGRAFTMIKDVLIAKLEKTLYANLFNSIILPAMLYTSEMWVTMKEEE